ncbi:MAG TPA: hypothetical protein PLV80_13755 [Prolixibacteraceae bacterium]|nr:hypothetical protein [Prolixibacteraceae bacterium]HQJ86867.1 hypothetical protein [Prolixibacteraceae bacterium]
MEQVEQVVLEIIMAQREDPHLFLPYLPPEEQAEVEGMLGTVPEAGQPRVTRITEGQVQPDRVVVVAVPVGEVQATMVPEARL